MKFKRVLAVLALVLVLVGISQAAPTIRGAMLYGLTTARGNLDACFKSLSENGVNTVRFFINFLDDSNSYANPNSPYQTVGTWKPDGQNSVPIRDLSIRNVAYVAKAQQIAAFLYKYNLTPWIVFDDVCSEEDGTINQFNDPYYSCVQMFKGWQSGDLTHAFGGGVQAVEYGPYRATLERDTLAIFKAAGCPKVYGEPKNEYGYEAGPAYTLQDELDWYQARAQSLQALGYDLVIGSARPPVLTLISGFVGEYDQHCIVTPADIASHVSGISPAHMIINTDGGDGAGQVSAWGGHSLNVAQAATLGQAVLGGGYFGWCFLPQETFDSRSLPMNLDVIDYAPIRAMALAAGWIAPVPPTPPTPEPPAPQPPAPQPPAPTPKPKDLTLIIVGAVIAVGAATLLIILTVLGKKKA